MKKSMPSNDDKDVDDDSLPESGSDIGVVGEPGISEEEESQSEGDQSAEGQSDGSVINEDDEDSEGGLSIGNDDEDDIVGSDAELPGGLLHFGFEEDDEAPWGGISSSVAGVKRKAADQQGSSGKKKRRLKDLPLFASLEDYEALIDAQPEDNI